MFANAETIAQAIITGCDTAERQIQTALRTGPGLLRAVIDSHIVTRFLPGFVKDKLADLIIAAAQRAANLMLDAIATFRLMARSVGRPTLLRSSAQALSTGVQTASTTLGSAMTPTALKGLDDDGWDSPASTSYSTAFSEQTRSVDRIAEVSRDLETTLNDMADSIESFFFDLQFSLAGLALSAAGLIIAIVTAPPTLGVGTVIGLIVSVASLIASVASAIMAFTNAAGRNSDAAETLANSPTITWADSAFAS